MERLWCLPVSALHYSPQLYVSLPSAQINLRFKFSPLSLSGTDATSSAATSQSSQGRAAIPDEI